MEIIPRFTFTAKSESASLAQISGCNSSLLSVNWAGLPSSAVMSVFLPSGPKAVACTIFKVY